MIGPEEKIKFNVESQRKADLLVYAVFIKNYSGRGVVWTVKTYNIRIVVIGPDKSTEFIVDIIRKDEE